MTLERPRSARYLDKEKRTDWRRIRFGVTVALYGGAVGAAAIIVNFVAQSPAYSVERLPLIPSVLFGASGFLAGSLIAGPVAYWIYGGLGFFYPQLRRSRSLLIWVVLGFAYGFVFPLIMGGVFLPVAFIIDDFVSGVTSVPDLLFSLLNLLTGLSPGLAFTFGFRLFFTGLIAGGALGVGAWAIDRLTTSPGPLTARYGGWVIALAMSGLIIAFAAFGPVGTLYRLG